MTTPADLDGITREEAAYRMRRAFLWMTAGRVTTRGVGIRVLAAAVEVGEFDRDLAARIGIPASTVTRLAREFRREVLE